MFKKSLGAVVILGALSLPSVAADVTLYGKIDMGLKYLNVDMMTYAGESDQNDTLELKGGAGQANRIGLKATEDLGNGVKVGFKLENGFLLDDGEISSDTRLFGREASLFVTGDYGSIYAGRFGAVSTTAGAFNVVIPRAENFNGGHKEVVGFIKLPRQDNMLGYQSPMMNGFQASFLYSFKGDNLKEAETHLEGHDSANRYGAFAATYDVGALQTGFSYEQVFASSLDNFEDSKVVTFGGNYKFGEYQLFAMTQYFEGMGKLGFVFPTKDLTVLGANSERAEGYMFHLGTKFKALEGDWDIGAYWADAKVNRDAGDVDGNYFGIASRYVYSFTKRTNLRLSVGYDRTTWDKRADVADIHDFEQDRYFGIAALTHNF